MDYKGFRFNMPVDYHIALKTIAAKEQTTVKDILLELIQNYLVEKKAIEA
jgi:hypothetical protein